MSPWTICDQQEINKQKKTRLSEDDYTLLDSIIFMQDQICKGAKW